MATKHGTCQNCNQSIVKHGDDFWEHKATGLYFCDPDTAGTVAEPK
jgi:hypothetical protein